MTRQIYEVVQHDGGWAYRVGDVFSETYPSQELARRAAIDAAARQERPGPSETIEYEDAAGGWHTERARGDDRPQTDVEVDGAAPRPLSRDVGADEPLPDGPRRPA